MEYIMNKYDVFISEGGYRVCLGVWNGSPIISNCPWFETKEETEELVIRLKKEEEAEASRRMVRKF